MIKSDLSVFHFRTIFLSIFGRFWKEPEKNWNFPDKFWVVSRDVICQNMNERAEEYLKFMIMKDIFFRIRHADVVAKLAWRTEKVQKRYRKGTRLGHFGDISALRG